MKCFFLLMWHTWPSLSLLYVVSTYHHQPEYLLSSLFLSLLHSRFISAFPLRPGAVHLAAALGLAPWTGSGLCRSHALMLPEHPPPPIRLHPLLLIWGKALTRRLKSNCSPLPPSDSTHHGHPISFSVSQCRFWPIQRCSWAIHRCSPAGILWTRLFEFREIIHCRFLSSKDYPDSVTSSEG